ncbi:MAG: glycerol-3-phosphate 1-O-acyltransferase PlsY [Candidatus Saganbacteria bacterium]|nr:glycerol-3-phosphate 1-O-acyltransferase PlsY [Candidatus Saganbacteria bacterium]
MSYILILAGYLLGSIPFGLIIGKIKGVDVRRGGSGNIGATNVMRTLGVVPGLAVFLLDTLKGALPVWLALVHSGDPLIVAFCGLAAIVGHAFSLFLGFKGGKGVATGAGVLLGIAPEMFVFGIVLFLVIAGLTRYVSAGSVLAALTVFFLFIMLDKPLPYTVLVGLAVVLIMVKHIPNLKRMAAGTERRIGGEK